MMVGCLRSTHQRSYKKLLTDQTRLPTFLDVLISNKPGVTIGTYETESFSLGLTHHTSMGLASLETDHQEESQQMTFFVIEKVTNENKRISYEGRCKTLGVSIGVKIADWVMCGMGLK